jgi:hypothetical protein
MVEGPIVTWEKIAKVMGCSVRKAKGLRGQMIEEGVIFKRRKENGSKVVCGLKEDLMRFSKKI